MGLESPARAAWRVLSARVGGWKVRFGWPASQSSSTELRARRTAYPARAGCRWRFAGRERPVARCGVEGRAKDGTGGWERSCDGGDPVYRAHRRACDLPRHLYIPTPFLVPGRTSVSAIAPQQERARDRPFCLCERRDPVGKMSWQSYIDDHLMCEVDGHHLTSAAIVGHDGSVWAQSAAFPAVCCGFVVP
jgi:hypothetical protein